MSCSDYSSNSSCTMIDTARACVRRTVVLVLGRMFFPTFINPNLISARARTISPRPVVPKVVTRVIDNGRRYLGRGANLRTVTLVTVGVIYDTCICNAFSAKR